MTQPAAGTPATAAPSAAEEAEPPELDAWLASVDLGLYAPQIREYGYHTLRVLRAATEADIAEMTEDADVQMKKPHRRLFLTEWKALVASAAPPAESEPEPDTEAGPTAQGKFAAFLLRMGLTASIQASMHLYPATAGRVVHRRSRGAVTGRAHGRLLRGGAQGDELLAAGLNEHGLTRGESLRLTCTPRADVPTSQPSALVQGA